MAENQKNQQTTGSQAGNQDQAGNSGERKVGTEEGQGTKMPGRESRTPVAKQEEENKSQGKSGDEAGRQGTAQESNRDANQERNDGKQDGNRGR
ncbi:MAG TPA: hypothetical protein VJY62_01710 [Bacteroidia bacterium]|nr:hypothetical protein [Bacteroidia bacterium]